MGSMRSRREEGDERSSSLHLAYDNVVRRAKERTKKLEAMEVLKRGVFRRLSMSPFHQNLSAERREFIEARLCTLIPQILDHTPNHPPYAEMIQRAIEWLGDEGGASEEAISNYILSTYKQLPWAHSHLLPHHLRRLTQAGEIKSTPNSRYSLSLSNPSHVSEQHQQPTAADDDDNAVLEATVRTRSRGKHRKEPSQRSQPQKRGRGNLNKKCRSEKEETPHELQVEIERKHPSLPPLPQPQRSGFSRKRGSGRQTHPGQAIRTEHFHGEGLIFHPKEPPDVRAGEKVTEKSLIVKFKATPHRKHEQLSRCGQKQPDDHVDCDGLMQMTVARNVGNDDSTSTVPCCDATRVLVGETGASKPNGEEHLQIVLSSTQQLKQAEARTTSSDANESFTGLSSGQVIAAMEGKGTPVSEDEEPFRTQEQLLLSPHRDEELNHPELESFATSVGNHGPMDAALEKGAFVTECNQLLQWQQHSSTPVVEQQKHPEVGSSASLANNDALMVLSAGTPMVVEDGVREMEKSKEQLPQEQQLSLQCTGDDDDDAIVVFCWKSKSIKKEKEGSPSKKSESTVRRSSRLANLYQQGEQVQSKPLTGVLLSLPDVKREEEVVFAIEAGKNVKEKQSSEQQQQKPNSKAKQLKKQKKGFRTKTEILPKKQKQKPKHHREEQKESGSEMEPSQRMQNLKPKCNREEQNESGAKLKPSKKKQEQQRKRHSKEQKESVTEMDPAHKKKQEQQHKRHSEEQREAGTEMEPSQKKHKQQAKHHSEGQKESGSEMEPSQNVWKQQPRCHREEQGESGEKIEPSQKKQEQQRKRHSEEQKELVTEIEPSQKKQKQQPKHHREEQKESGSKMEPLRKKQPRRHCKQQKESGTEMEPSQRMTNPQSERHSEEQDELVTEMELLQKKHDDYLEEEPKEVGTKMEVSQKQRMELGMSKKELQIQQNQEDPKGQMKRGRHSKGSGLQQKVPGKRGRPPKGTGLLEKQQGPKEQDENVEQDKAMPLDMGVASAVGEVQLGKSPMAVKYQEPSESQKKARDQGKLMEKEEVPLQARGRGRPPKKKEVPVERTFQVQGCGDKDLPVGQGKLPKEGHVKTRGRGRPSKELPLETTGEVQNCGDKEVNVEKRGRGRPRKNKEVPAETTVEVQAFGDKEVTMGQGKPTNEEVAVEPMSRRRPLKEVAVRTRGQGRAPKKEVLGKTRGSKQVTQEGGSCGDNCPGSGSRLRKAS